MMLPIFSCKKEHENITPAAASESNQEFQAKLGRKWEVQTITPTSTSRIHAFELPWFEFLSADNKYIVHDGAAVYYGNYSTNATKDTILLTGFGLIAVSRLDDSVFNFSLKKDGSPNFVNVFTTVVNPSIPSSTATDLLCAKAWTIHWQVLEGDTIFYNSSSSGITNIEVRFSKNGTYLNHTETVNVFADTDIVKYWKWKNTEETEIITSNSSTFDDVNEHVIYINKLTENAWDFSYGNITAGSASR